MKKKLYLIIVILLLMSSGVIIYIKNLNNIIIEGNNARNNINNQQIQDNENKKEEIFNYIAEELPKIVNESQTSIFIKSNEHEDMVAINSVQSGSTQYDGKTVYFLNAEASSMDIDIGLKNDLINNILFTLNYKGQYYEAYVKKPKLRYYYGKIIYEIDISNYSNIIPLIDKRYINDNLAVSNGTEPNADYSNGHFSVHLENGEFSNSKLVYKSSSIFSDNKRLNDEFEKYIEENLANKMEQESAISNNTNEVYNSSDSETKTNKQTETDQNDNNITQQSITSNINLVLNSMKITNSNNYELVVQVSLSTNGDWNSIANTLNATANGNVMSKTISEGIIIFKYSATLKAGDNVFSVSVNGDDISKTENYNVTLNLPQLYIHNNLLTDTMGNYTTMDISVSSDSYSGGNYLSEGITVTVNGKETELSGSSYKYRISEGETSFNIVVTDSYGQTFTKTVNI